MKIISVILGFGLLLQAYAIEISTINLEPEPNAKQLVFNLNENIFGESLVGSYTHEKLLKCSPSIGGSYEFSATNSLTLYPNESLKAGTSYSCTLNKTTYTPNSDDNATFLSKKLSVNIERFEKMISLRFNTKVDPKELKKYLKISRSKNLALSNLAYELTSEKDQHNFLAFVKEDTKLDALQINIDKLLSNSLLQDITQKLDTNSDAAPYLDPKLNGMLLLNKARAISKDNGSFALRVYLPYYIYNISSITPFVSVKGIQNISINSIENVYSREKRENGLSKSAKYYFDINGNFEPNKTYEVTIKAGLKARYSHQLRNSKTFNVKTADREEFISFNSNKPYLSSAGAIGITSVNTRQATIVIEHLLDENYRYFTTFKRAKSGLLYQMVTEVARKTFNISSEKNKFTNFKIDIKSFLKNFKQGVYRLTIHYNGSSSTSKVVFFSDIGITTKLANDQMFIWTTKLSDGSVIKNASVKIYSRKNELLKQLKTNNNGIAIINNKGFVMKQPTTIVVSSQNEQNFLFLDTVLNKVSLPYSERFSTMYKTFIYLQSKLIRPGNDANILMIIKNKNYVAGLDLPIHVIIKDPKNQKVYNKTLKTNKHGAVNIKFFIDNGFKTGKYRIDVKLGGYRIGSSTFSVENFIPQKIKNKIEFKKEYLKAGELLHVTVSSKYLHGAPGANLKAKAKLTAVSKVYTNKKYKNFNFNNELLIKNNTTNYLLKNKSFTLNSEGKSQIIFDSKIFQNPPSMLQAQLALTVFDDGRGVSTYKNIDLYPYTSMVGIKINTPSIEKNQKLKAKTIVIEPQSGKKLSHKLEVVIKKSDWNYYYDSRGYYHWQKKYYEYSRFYIQSGDKIDLTMKASGSYTLEITDHLSGHSSTQDFSVSGWDYTPIDPTADMAKIQVKLNKDKQKIGFLKGDTLHVDIKSPLLKGTMLLSIETNKVLWYKIIKLKKGNASLKIPLNFNFPNGAYFRTHMVRATDTPSTLIPFRASSATFIKPNKTAHQQKIKINAPKITRSNHEQVISVTTKPNSSVIISVVDEGILQIINQTAPKPFKFFERKSREQIALFDLYDKVMNYKTKGKLLSFGADGSKKLKRSRKHLGAKTGAKRVKPFVYWSSIITADKNGKASIKLPIPEYNGQAQIVAISFDKNSIGSNSQAIIVRDDIIIKPTFSRFVHVGDELKVPVRVFNTTKIVQDIQLSAKTSENISFDFNTSTLSIEPKSSKLIFATLKGKAFGKGVVKITVINQMKETFASSVELPVTSAYALQTKVYKGETTKAIDIKVDKKYFTDSKTKFLVNISDSYLSQIKGSVNSLIGYPHGCAEQTSSKVLGMLYIDKFIKGESKEQTELLLEDRKHFIEEGIHKLYGMQTNFGEFSYWRSGGYVNSFASIYASDIVLELKRKGFNIPDDMLNKIFYALKNQSNGYGSYRYGETSNFARMYAAYLLSKEKQLDISTANVLYDQNIYKGNFVSLYMMAAILQEAKLDDALNKVLAEIENFDFDKFSNERSLGRNFYSKNRDLSFALYIHVTNFEKNALSSRLLEAIFEESKNIYSTQDKAFMMRAMSEYYKNQVDNTFSADLKYNNKVSNLTKVFYKEDFLTDNKISLTPNSGIVNYTFEVSNYIEKDIYHSSLEDQYSTVKINRTFVDEKNHKINPDTLNVGDLFYSKLSLSSTKKLDNLVISNRIPACFEIVNERLQKHQRPNDLRDILGINGIDYTNYLDDKVLTFLGLDSPSNQDKEKNRITIFQPMRILAEGKCEFPAVVVEAMYDGRITAYDKEYKELIIKNHKKKDKEKKSSNLSEKW